MNKFFKSAIERFNKIKEKEYHINPISETDGEIIIELTQIIKKLGCNEVLDILKHYKEYSDTEIYDTLLQFNIDHPNLGMKGLVNKMSDKIREEIEDDEFEDPYKIYIQLGDYRMLLGHLIGIKLEDDEINNLYNVIINPTPEDAKKLPLFANFVVEFNDYENRNKCIENLEITMQNCGINLINLME